MASRHEANEDVARDRRSPVDATTGRDTQRRTAPSSSAKPCANDDWRSVCHRPSSQSALG